MEANITAYGIFTGCGTVLCILWFFLSFRRKADTGRAAALSALVLLLGAVLGFLCARGAWILMRFNVFRAKDLLTLRYDELSWWGGAGGVILAVWLSAKILRLPSREVLNAFAPAGALLAAVFRFAEGYLGFHGLGFVQAWVEKGLFFPVTTEIVWDETYSEFYLAVYMLSGLCCLGAMAFALLRGKDRDRLVRTLFYLCLPQILLESLRMQSINWLFVRVEQLLCFLVCEGIIVRYAFRGGAKRLRSWIPALAGLAVCGVVIAGEFALDGKIRIGEEAISHGLIYGIFALVLLGLAAVEHRAHRQFE